MNLLAAFVAALAALVALMLVLTTTLFVSTPRASTLLGPSAAAVADIPADMLALYQQAASQRCPGLPWTVLAAVGKVETNHARNVAVSSAGALGPMQFMPPTWRAYGLDATGNGIADVWDVVDSVHSAARYLCATGGGDPATLRDAIFAYNRANWYVDLVLEHAAGYAEAVFVPDPDAAALLENPRIALTPRVRDDLQSGVVDPRVVAVLSAMSARHTLSVSVMRSGHSKHVAGTSRISNHWCGQAADVWMIDGQRVSPRHPSARAAAGWLRSLTGPMRPTEVGTPWADLAGGGFFSDRHHQGHLHIGYGPRCPG